MTDIKKKKRLSELKAEDANRPAAALDPINRAVHDGETFIAKRDAEEAAKHNKGLDKASQLINGKVQNFQQPKPRSYYPPGFNSGD